MDLGVGDARRGAADDFRDAEVAGGDADGVLGVLREVADMGGGRPEDVRLDVERDGEQALRALAAGGQWSAPMVVRTPYGAGIRALEHHSESLEGAYAHVPGLQVVIPSTPYDTKGLLKSAIRSPDPVLFMEPKHIYRSVREDVPDDDYEVPIGEAAVRREGEDVTVVSWGAMMQKTLEAVDRIDADAEVIDLRTISPMDRETVVESVRKTGRCVVVHEAPYSGGWASEIIATINDEVLMYLEAPVESITGYDIPVPLLSMEDYYIPHPPRIAAGIEDVLDY
ncbi:alpha-ketoacid dehydrogenase subunit beta [Halobellus sp. EA9]|uniref:alpha-ketoacid dehydrogenase subunit beta n=1 Tax=Halobellus sp. EA9 TaxID=3421647 RepID=UPI003EBE4651